MPKVGSLKCRSCVGQGICAVGITPRHAICAAFLKQVEARPTVRREPVQQPQAAICPEYGKVCPHYMAKHAAVR